MGNEQQSGEGFRFTISNDGHTPLRLQHEPIGQPYEIPPGELWEISGEPNTNPNVQPGEAFQLSVGPERITIFEGTASLRIFPLKCDEG